MGAKQIKFMDSIEEDADELKTILETLKNGIEKNFDGREKKVGDRVKIWDFSMYVTKHDNVKHSSLNSYFKNNEAIIIAENLKKTSTLLDEEILMDVLLKFPDGSEVYTCSDFIKRTDTYEQ